MSSVWSREFIVVSYSISSPFGFHSLTRSQVLTLRAFMQRRAQFSQFLSSSTTSSLTINRYFRLMALATLEIIFAIPFSSYGLYANITQAPIYPWTSWSNIHFMWYTIDTFPAILWRSNSFAVIGHESSRWSLVFCAFLFFGFFGFAEESRKNYRRAYWAIAARFGVTPPDPSNEDPFRYNTPHPLRINTIAYIHIRRKGFMHAMKSTVGTLPLFVSPNSKVSTDRDSYKSVTSCTTNSNTLCTTPKTADSKMESTKALMSLNESRLSRSSVWLLFFLPTFIWLLRTTTKGFSPPLDTTFLH